MAHLHFHYPLYLGVAPLREQWILLTGHWEHAMKPSHGAPNLLFAEKYVGQAELVVAAVVVMSGLEAREGLEQTLLASMVMSKVGGATVHEQKRVANP